MRGGWGWEEGVGVGRGWGDRAGPGEEGVGEEGGGRESGGGERCGSRRGRVNEKGGERGG